MRTFIAISLTKASQIELSLLQDRLGKSKADIKWVAPSNIHITLKFLGNIQKSKINQLSPLIENALQGFKIFDIAIAGLGAFPCICSPEIIWAGISKGRGECIGLQKTIESRIKDLDLCKDTRAFFPHVTIGRVVSSSGKGHLVGMIEKEKDFSVCDEISVKKVAIFSSQLTAKGPIYTTLEEFPLSVIC
jgi:RNA 2',3'-cyclic 3'-phosphodiesterase